MCRLAIGPQTVHSTITPVSYCGVVGFATSHGRIPFDGVPLVPSLDTVGFLGADIAAIDAALSATAADWEPVAARQPLVGVCKPWGVRRLHTEAWAAFESHVRALRDAGFECRSAVMPWDEEGSIELARLIGDLVNAEFAQVHREWFARFGDLYRPATADAVRRGGLVDPARVAETRIRRRQMVDELERLTQGTGVDCWVCPSGQLAPSLRVLANDTWMTCFWAFAGWPSVSLPVFDGERGLPHGLRS